MKRKDTKSLTEQIIENSKAPAEHKEDSKIFLPTGSVMLNLGCSDRIDGGFRAGKMANIIGDSSSGKTLLAFGMFAELARDERFDKYEFVHDDAERGGDGFDVERMFGKAVKTRLKNPQPNKKNSSSETIQDFFYNVKRKIESGNPFIYVLDSFDSITSIEEMSKIEENMLAYEKGREGKGSYGDGKARKASEMFRSIIRDLNDTDSYLSIISQTRDKLNAMNPFDTKTRSGGRALKFYSWHEIWLALKGNVVEKKRKIGVHTRARISKNRNNGKLRDVDFPIYYDYGVDDIGAMIEFMVEEKQWGKSGNSIVIPAIDFKGTEDKLIKLIESDKKIENKIRRMVQKTWNDIEESLQLGRKKKYE